jgi:alginate O-acetyltransferase complex protein AlgI
MVFNSFQFIIFFIVVITLFHTINQSLRPWLLLVASYYFYMSWKFEYGFLLLTSSFISWMAGILMSQTDHPKKRKLFFFLGVFSDLGILFFFKYFNFFNYNIAGLLNIFNFQIEPLAINILLPVGISFYTFQTLSYTIDVYRRSIVPEKNFFYFALYASYFPQLVAGPIERTQDLLPQLKRHNQVTKEDVIFGIQKILWGFFKKVAIADQVSMYVNYVYAEPGQSNGMQLYIATLLFAVQIFADFSGYCDIAVGAARLIGVRLAENFNRPYLSLSISEYWTRWHITLGGWLRDYVFFPLNKGVVDYWRIYLNTIITFLLVGIWHGASWNFVLLGLINGVLIVLQSLYRKSPFFPPFKTKFAIAILWFWNFQLILMGTVLFRAHELKDILTVYKTIGTGLFSEFNIIGSFSVFDFGISCIVSIFLAYTGLFWKNFKFKYNYAFIFIMLIGIFLLGKNEAESFVYFQF